MRELGVMLLPRLSRTLVTRNSPAACRVGTPTLAKDTVTVIALALVFFFVSGPAGFHPAGAQERAPDPPSTRATAWALVDADTGLYLAGKNPDERLPIASTTNIMVALVALEEGADLEEEVAITGQAERFVGFTYSNIGLIEGERLSVRELLKAALIPSGTEAVYALSEHLGGGSVDVFVEEMNAQASSMGLKNTHFEDPAGLDASGHYSSTRDLATIARAAMEHPTFADIVDTEEATISTQNREIEFFNTNNLLYAYEPANGVKTGTSPQAGPCLVASATEGDESYIAVVLDAAGEEYRFDAARTALEYSFDNYEREPLARKGEVYEEIQPPFRREKSVGLVAAKDIPGPAGPGLEVERRVTAKEVPPAAKAGQELGTVEVLVEGKSVGSSPLVTKRSYEEASLWQKARYALAWPADRLWTSLLG
ncbi:MAG: D-alanyl-D-alanine carboxypeptidase [Actinomycetota bacterium]|nr:D-alanyl-D-alanine carboxypeptidase [Actinomycetota bacterium]